MSSIGADAKAAIVSPAAGGPPPARRRDLAVTVWLWALALCVFAMVVVGGATRLTESGLSITQWKPIEGVLPPLSRADWLAAFAAYRATPQFAHLFPDMTLAHFKFIFMWEWSHRLLGRAIGLVVVLPLAWFWLKGRIDAPLGRRLLGVLALGGLQGLIGWLMVKSGLTHRVEVAPEMLATHLLLASCLLVLLVAIACGPAAEPNLPARLRRWAAAIPLLILLQIGLGGLVAGSRAGRVYNTWPAMDGGFAPSLTHLLSMRPVWLNWFENVALVQLDHRLLAYALLAVAIWHAGAALATAPRSALARRAIGLALLVLVQASLGVATLLLSVPLWAGLLHQAFAMIVLTAATIHWRRSRRPAGAPAAAATRPITSPPDFRPSAVRLTKNA
jgi:heme a synthase